MAESRVSRRISEFVGVALFALTLIWLIALVTHEPTDPVWFFTTDTAQAPVNFIGRVGAFSPSSHCSCSGTRPTCCPS